MRDFYWIVAQCFGYGLKIYSTYYRTKRSFMSNIDYYDVRRGTIETWMLHDYYCSVRS